MTTLPYIYKVTDIVKVTDGDTYWLRLDVGFRQEILIDCRLSGYDCPERNSGSAFEKEQAVKATEVATDFLLRWPGDLWVRTEKDPDSFGRWLGEVWREDANGARTRLGDILRLRNLASIWPIRWREEFDQDA